MTTPRASALRGAPGDDRGFVMVGVVMFVLALTILGLSLFSLSSYESQFLNRSLARQQAFDAAWSGIERARYRLASNATLDQVKGINNIEGVNYEVAFQMQGGAPDSVGAMDPSKVVTILVQTTVEGETQRLEADFQPNATQDYYRRLITTSTIVDVGNLVGVPGVLSHNTVKLDGNVLANGGIPNAANLASPLPPVTTTPPVPVPPISTFLAQPRTYQSVQRSGLGTYNLTGTSGVVTNWQYVRQPLDPLPVFGFGIDEPSGITINVTGIAVLMLPNGIHTFGAIQVNGGTNDGLVIIAGKPFNNLYDNGNTGIALQNSIRSANVPVILVTDGRAEFDNFNFGVVVYTVRYLSVYANKVFVAGPVLNTPLTPGLMTLRHDPNAPEDQPSGLIDKLRQAGAIPNPPSPGGTLALVPGSWRQSAN